MFGEKQLTKMNPLLIVNTVLNIINQLDDEKFAQVSSLLKTVLKRKFQLQKFNDENNKFLSSCSYPDGLKIKDFRQTQVVYLYSLLAALKIKQPMLNQVLFVQLQTMLATHERVKVNEKIEFIRTLLDQIKNIQQEDHAYQLQLITSMAFAIFDNLYQLKELNHPEILMLLSHVNQYFIVLKQMQPHQVKYVA